MALLAAKLTAGDLLTCGIVRIEVLRGVIKPKVKAELTRFFDIVPEIPLSPSLLRETAELAWTLDRQGQVLPVTEPHHRHLCQARRSGGDHRRPAFPQDSRPQTARRPVKCGVARMPSLVGTDPGRKRPCLFRSACAAIQLRPPPA